MRRALFRARRHFNTREGLVSVSHDEVNPSVAIVSLNNPDKLNALTVEMGNEFRAVVDELTHAGRDLRAVVLTGCGRAFSAGGDLEFLRSRVRTGEALNEASIADNKQAMLDFYDRFLCIKKVHVPVVAAVNGPAVGAGLCLALATDLRIVSTTAKLAVNFVKIGIHPGMAASYHLPHLIGQQQASRMILTGEQITGEEAARIGLCLKAVPTEDVVPEALTLARNIAQSAALPVNQAVETLRAGMGSMAAATDRESSCQAQNFGIGGQSVLDALDARNKSRAKQA